MRTDSIAPWQPHPEVWLLVGAILALGWFANRVIGPKVVADGAPPTTTRQRGWFFGGVIMIWLAADWPMHDIAEQQLYSMHMVQHLILTIVAPAMFLLATPEWLARLIINDNGPSGRALAWMAKPVPAGLQFALLGALTHWSGIVNFSLESGGFHYGVHVVLVLSALLFWMPVCSPIPELRLGLPGQMIYLFVASIPPTVPGAWLAISEGVVYSGYDIPERLWGLSVTSDQQLAGIIMKLIGGTYLWVIILTLFVRWVGEQEQPDRSRRRQPTSLPEPSGREPAGDSAAVNWDSIEAELDGLAPVGGESVPAEPDRGRGG